MDARFYYKANRPPSTFLYWGTIEKSRLKTTKNVEISEVNCLKDFYTRKLNGQQHESPNYTGGPILT